MKSKSSKLVARKKDEADINSFYEEDKNVDMFFRADQLKDKGYQVKINNKKY